MGKGEIIPEEKAREAVAKCMKHVRHARYFNEAPSGAKQYIALVFYETVFPNDLSEEVSEQCFKEVLQELNNEIQRLSSDGHKVSLVMADLRARSGVAYHSAVPMCSQSTIKAIYAGALIESCPEALTENGQYLHDAVVYSSNDAYEKLRSIYGSAPIKRWCMETGVDTDFGDPNYPRNKTARDMFKMWTRLYCFLNGGADRTNFGAYYADSRASASAKQLPVPVQTKAGWENGLGDYRPFELWEIPEGYRDGDPLNDECAINDTGIVYGKNGPYIFVIYTDHPFAFLPDKEMENPLNGLVKLLYRMSESLNR